MAPGGLFRTDRRSLRRIPDQGPADLCGRPTPDPVLGRDKEGATRYTTEVVGREMKMLGQKGDGGSPRNKTSRPAPPPEPPDDFEDDIPF